MAKPDDDNIRRSREITGFKGSFDVVLAAPYEEYEHVTSSERKFYRDITTAIRKLGLECFLPEEYRLILEGEHNSTIIKNILMPTCDIILYHHRESNRLACWARCIHSLGIFRNLVNSDEYRIPIHHFIEEENYHSMHHPEELDKVITFKDYDDGVKKIVADVEEFYTVD